MWSGVQCSGVEWRPRGAQVFKFRGTVRTWLRLCCACRRTASIYIYISLSRVFQRLLFHKFSFVGFALGYCSPSLLHTFGTRVRVLRTFDRPDMNDSVWVGRLGVKHKPYFCTPISTANAVALIARVMQKVFVSHASPQDRFVQYVDGFPF